MFINFKKIMILVILMTLLLVLVTPTYATSISLEGQILQGRFLVPMRGIFEALGASVQWDGDTRTVTGNRAGTTVLLSIDSKIAKVNDNTVELDVPATIVEGRTYVPLRFISESLGANVSWDGERRIATITGEERVIQVREKLNLPEKKTFRFSDIDGYYETELTLYISELGYAVYYNDDVYKVARHNGIDKFEVILRDYSYYDFEIWREELDHEVVSRRIQLELQNNYNQVFQRILYTGAVSYEGNGNGHKSNYHIFKNPHGGCFVIKDKFYYNSCDTGIIDTINTFRILK